MESGFGTIIAYILSFFSAIYPETNDGISINSIENLNSMGNKKVIVDFTLNYREVFKNSKSRTAKIFVFENSAFVLEEYYGIDAPYNRERNIWLNKEKRTKILNFIKSEGLHINLKEQKEKKGTGVSGDLKIVVYDSDTTSLIIQGQTSIWGSGDYVKEKWGGQYIESRTNLKNVEYFSKADRFLRFVTGL